MITNSMDSLNAKRMTANQVAESFVVPPGFERLASQDHVYVIGPRGSGKTTMLRMLTSESLVAWHGADAIETRARVDYSAVFVPADELWASQSSIVDVRAAFATQVAIALVEVMSHRVRKGGSAHLPVRMDRQAEIELVAHLARLWGLSDVTAGLSGLLSALELFLADLPRRTAGNHPFSGDDAFRVLVPAITAFNRAAGQVGHRWALLLDEMELAPTEVHRMVTAFVRGGSPLLILKISMSPFDRFMEHYGADAMPAPGNDFQTIYLSGHSPRELRSLTGGLWIEALKARGLPIAELNRVLSSDASSRRQPNSGAGSDIDLLSSMAERDVDFRRWLARRRINLAELSEMTYYERSATIRKVQPLLVYRDALLNFRQGKPVMRSRKKSYEPFVGANAVATILEGNPRWIKSAFAYMLEYYDTRTRSVSEGFQLDAMTSVANRFEALLRVLPLRGESIAAAPPLQLVDGVARYLRARNLGPFSADVPTSFIVDKGVSPEVEKGLLLALYAGAIVHLRDRTSPAVLSSFRNQRFRLTHLLSVRDGKELPLRLGKDVNLTTALAARSSEQGSSELPIDWGIQ